MDKKYRNILSHTIIHTFYKKIKSSYITTYRLKVKEKKEGLLKKKRLGDQLIRKNDLRNDYLSCEWVVLLILIEIKIKQE